MNDSRSNHPASSWLNAALASVALAAPAAHATVTGELSVGLVTRGGGDVRVEFPNSSLGESRVLGETSGTKELLFYGDPNTRAAVQGNLSSGTLRAVAQTDYIRAEWDRYGYSDTVSWAAAKVNMSDTVTFANVAIGDVGHLDLLVNGSFSPAPNARLVLSGSASASTQVYSADRRVNLTRSVLFAGNNASQVPGALPQPVTGAIQVDTGNAGPYLDTVSFELRPGSYTFSWELAVRGTGYDVDFGSTAHVYLRLPEGVTYTSQSGAFLATATPLSPVPLPPMLHQALLGLGLLAGWLRYLGPKGMRAASA